MTGSIFRYPGGKSKKSIRDQILALAPPSYWEYREPFVGGGGVFFGVGLDRQRWINDRDEHLMSVYLALRDRPEEFIQRCREIEPHSQEEAVPPPLYNHRLRQEFNRLAFNETCDQALRYFFVNRTVWAGRVRYDRESRMYFSNPTGWNITMTSRLEEAARWLQGTQITCGGYETLLEAPGKGVWVYCDPPYFVNNDLDEGSRLYRYNFVDGIEHKKLAERARECQHCVCISYDDRSSHYVRDLYDGFRIVETSWKYSGTSAAERDASRDNGKRAGKELLICNYDRGGKLLKL